MSNLNSDVYEVLKTGTAGLAKMQDELKALRDDEQSGIYSDMMLNNDIRPKIAALKEDISKEAESVLSEAHGLVEEHKKKLRAADEINGADITEDAALFKVGVPLTEKDLRAILARNKGNATMEQLTLRYAEQNGIELKDIGFIGHAVELQEAESLNEIVNVYSRWITAPDARDILDQFFGNLV